MLLVKWLLKNGMKITREDVKGWWQRMQRSHLSFLRDFLLLLLRYWKEKAEAITITHLDRIYSTSRSRKAAWRNSIAVEEDSHTIDNKQSSTT